MSTEQNVSTIADLTRYEAKELPPYRTPYTEATNVYKPGSPTATEAEFLEALRMLSTEERLTFTQGLAATGSAEGKTSFEVWQALPENLKKPYINVSTWIVSHDNSMDQEKWSTAIVIRHMSADHVEEAKYIHAFEYLEQAQTYRSVVVNNGYYAEPKANWHGYTIEEMINLRTA